MTENEAKEFLTSFTLERIGYAVGKDVDTERFDYFTDVLKTAIVSLEEIQQYRSIGTIDECRDAVEKQRVKKPIMKPYFEDMEEEYLCCPTCGEILTDRIPSENKDFYFHCLNCGQAFSWERDSE